MGGMTPPPSPVSLLERRVRGDGGRPFLTYYHPAAGERVEFSARSFANWVDKTANLLGTLGVEGELVAGPLSVNHPGHWMSLVWPLACWQAGSGWAALPLPVPDGAGLAVVGPEDPRPLLPEATLACSLHPLGLSLAGLPEGVLDYSSNVLAEPDAHWAVPVAAGDLAWLDAERSVSHGELAGLEPITGRVLVRPVTAWQALSEAVLRPLLGGGSAVVVAGEVDDERLARIVASENVVAGLE